MSKRKLELATLEIASTNLTGPVIMTFSGRVLELLIEQDDDGSRVKTRIAFDNVRAHSHRAEGASTADDVEGSYDIISEVVDSPWLAEVVDLARSRGFDLGELHHYMLYLDSEGTFEAIAGSWTVGPA
jgi:hypothetical protein